jgi:hypothetical protein
MAALEHLREFTGTSSSTAAATEVTIQVDSAKRAVEILRIMVDWSAGSAATFQPSIGNSTGFSTGTISEKYLGAATAVANLFDVSSIGGFCETDSSGRLFLKFGPSAGADNTFAYSICLRIWS